MGRSNREPSYYEEIQGGDIVPNQTSSIGSLGEKPEKASFHRLKTFNPKIQDLEEFKSWYEFIEKFPLEPYQRITVRSVVPKKALAEYLDRGDPNNSELIEGIIDLDGCGIPDLENYVIVYLGKNGSSRETDNGPELIEQLKEAQKIFAEIKPEPKEPPENTKHVLMIQGWIQEREDQIETIQEQYIELLETFGWNRNDAQELIKNSTIDLILSTNPDAEQLVLGAGLAEWAEVEIKGKKLQMVELTEAVVHPKARGLGIYHAITTIQLRRVFAAGANIVYGESNLAPASRGVICVAAKNGRQPANIWEYNGKRYEFNRALVAHVPAGSKGNSNFLVTFITQKRYYEKVQRKA